MLFAALALLVEAGAVQAQKQPATTLLAVNIEGDIGGDLDEPSGIPDAMIQIDISGVESWDLMEDPDNTVLTETLDSNAVVTGIGWSVTLETIGASWLSEAVTYFDGSDLDGSGLVLTVGFGDGMPGVETYESDGIFDLTDNGIPNIPLGSDALLYMQFFESFDDVSDAVDAFYQDGSYYDIVGFDFDDITCVCDIPTLDPLGLIALAALLAFLGTFVLRRRFRLS